MAKHVKRSPRLVVAGAIVASCAAVGVVTSSRVAHADAPALQGWWTVTNTGTSLPVQPSDPLVPSTGLLVEGGASSPSAYAALSYDIASGVTANKLTLAVTANSASTPGASLQLCRLSGSTFSPEQGGQMANAP